LIYRAALRGLTLVAAGINNKQVMACAGRLNLKLICVQGSTENDFKRWRGVFYDAWPIRLRPSDPTGITFYYLQAAASRYGSSTRIIASVERDIFEVAARKRADADKVRFELNGALKELYSLQSQVMMLERENAIIDEQLKRNASRTGLPASAANSRRPGQHATGGFGGQQAIKEVQKDKHSTSALVDAIYETDSIKRLVQEFEGINAETSEVEFRGQIYDHMRARLAEEVVECRRVARGWQDRVHDERGRNNDLHRREMEIQRHLTSAQNRLNQTKRDVDSRMMHWSSEIRERTAYIKKKKEFNAYMESQVCEVSWLASCLCSGLNNSSVSVQLHAPLMPATPFVGDSTARSTSGANQTSGADDDRRRAVAQVISARHLKRRLSRAATEVESQESRYYCHEAFSRTLPPKHRVRIADIWTHCWPLDCLLLRGLLKKLPDRTRL
jgi:hypothetical protein